MKLTQVREEAAPGGVIRHSHIDTIVSKSLDDKIITVGESGEYVDIKEAYDSATAGQLVWVSPGEHTLNESIVLKSNVDIYFAPRAIVQSTTSVAIKGSVFTDNASSVTSNVFGHGIFLKPDEPIYLPSGSGEIEGFAYLVGLSGNSHVMIEGHWTNLGSTDMSVPVFSKSISGTEDKNIRMDPNSNKELINRQKGIRKGGNSRAEGTYTIAEGIGSHAEGLYNTSIGSYSHAEGTLTKSVGSYSHAEGNSATSAGERSHAEGYYTTSVGNQSHAEGEYTKSIGIGSHAEGYSVTANGDYSHAQGRNTMSIGYYSHAQGRNTTAIGNNSHTEGYNTTSVQENCHAEGSSSTAVGQNSHAEGGNTAAIASHSHAEGQNSTAIGTSSHAEGYYATAIGQNSHAEGFYTKSIGIGSHAEGYYATSTGSYSHAEGYSVTANGYYSHAEGYYSSASGMASHAEGRNTTSIGSYSHAEGQETTAVGEQSHAEGYYAKATGISSHAQNGETIASGDYSHAEGYSTMSIGHASHTQGSGTIAHGSYAHAGNLNTSASGRAQFVIGQYNAHQGTPGSTVTSDSAFIIGNGTISARGDAFRVTWAGNATCDGAFTGGGADYAESFEWEDGNPDNEDRVGYFVELANRKTIKLFETEGDEPLGIISGRPAVIGDEGANRWANKYLTDDWGRIQYETINVTDTKSATKEVELDYKLQENETLVTENEEFKVIKYTENVISGTQQVAKVNPDFDPNVEYTPRLQRKEWDAVGLLGKLKVWDDGTCQVNGWCKPVSGGTATKATKTANVKYKVIDRITDNIIEILFK